MLMFNFQLTRLQLITVASGKAFLTGHFRSEQPDLAELNLVSLEDKS